MKQDEQTDIEKSTKKLKSLVVGRIFSLVPLASTALLFITSALADPIISDGSKLRQIWNTFIETAVLFFMNLCTIPSFVCCAVGIGILLFARKKGGKKTIPFIFLCIIGMIFSVLFTLFFLLYMNLFESTKGQIKELSKISEIEEFVLTDDSEAGGFHDGIMYNDLDLYLSGGRFLQVSNMSEDMYSFNLNAAGDWNLFVVYENEDNELTERSWLKQEELSELCGSNIKKLVDLISLYDTFMEKVETMPLLDENPTETGFFKSGLQQQKLALREEAIYEDLLQQEGVISVEKVKGRYEYLENYWYKITMDDGHSFLMTTSAVFPKEDGSMQSYFCIRDFDGEPISLLSMRNTTYGINYYSSFSGTAFEKRIGAEMQSYRDFFPHYKEFLDLKDELLEESRNAKNDKHRNSGGGMQSGVYRLQ